MHHTLHIKEWILAYRAKHYSVILKMKAGLWGDWLTLRRTEFNCVWICFIYLYQSIPWLAIEMYVGKDQDLFSLVQCLLMLYSHWQFLYTSSANMIWKFNTRKLSLNFDIHVLVQSKPQSTQMVYRRYIRIFHLILNQGLILIANNGVQTQKWSLPIKHTP